MPKIVTLILACLLVPARSWADDVAPTQRECAAEKAAAAAVKDKIIYDVKSRKQHTDDVIRQILQDNPQLSIEKMGVIYYSGFNSVDINDKLLSFYAPEFEKKNIDVIFEAQTVKMERQKTGEVPVFVCGGPLHLGCTTKWNDLYTNVPVPIYEKRAEKFDIPDYKLFDTKVAFSYPEIYKDKEVIPIVPITTLAIPEINLSTLIKNDIENSATEIELIRTQNNAEVLRTTRELYSCYYKNLEHQRLTVAKSYESGLAELNSAIDEVAKKGVDPKKVTASDGSVTDLLSKRADLEKQRDIAVGMFDETLKQLSTSEQSAEHTLEH